MIYGLFESTCYRPISDNSYQSNFKHIQQKFLWTLVHIHIKSNQNSLLFRIMYNIYTIKYVTINTNIQPYATSCVGSSLDSELIPLESGETCVAAVMIAHLENSKLITTAQMINRARMASDREISSLHSGFRSSQL